VKVLPWRLLGKSADESVADAPGSTAESRERPLPSWVAKIVAIEPILAPVCALLLLLAPNPLVWPAAFMGLLPSAARLLATGRPWRATAFDLPLVLLAIGALLGGYASLSRESAAIRLAGLLAALLLFVVALEHANGPVRLRRIVVGSLVGTVVASILLLVLVGPFLLLERIPMLASLVAAVDPTGFRNWFVDQDWLLQRYRFRASGVGALADVGLALALAALVGLSGRVPRLLVGLSIPVFLLLLVVADNRGSMLAGALTLGLMATVWQRRLLALVPVIALLGLLFLALVPGDRGLNFRTLAQRFWFWENSVFLAREVPLTGAGLGLESVQLVYRGYFLPSYPPFSHAHNIYLQGLLEYGALGLLGLLGLVLATLWVGWRSWADSDRWCLAGRLAGYGVAMAMFTTGLTEIVMHSTLGAAMAVAAVGLLAATVTSPRYGAASSALQPGPEL
jgi:O-antigen ligase